MKTCDVRREQGVGTYHRCHTPEACGAAVAAGEAFVFWGSASWAAVESPVFRPHLYGGVAALLPYDWKRSGRAVKDHSGDARDRAVVRVEAAPLCPVCGLPAAGVEWGDSDPVVVSPCGCECSPRERETLLARGCVDLDREEA